jgi:hypothetical protein
VLLGGPSGGGVMDFLTPSGYAASMVDSVEEMFSVDKKRMETEFENGNDNVVKLIFPLCMREVGLWSLSAAHGRFVDSI